MRNRKILAVLALLAVVAATLGAVSLGGGHGGDNASTQRPVPAANATDFIDSIGVGLHLGYGDTAYRRQPEVLARLRELGVRHIRDSAPFRVPALERGLRGATRMGVHATLITDLRTAPADAVASGIRATSRRLDAFEPPNEPDRSGPPDWMVRLRGYMSSLRREMRARRARAPLLGPSFANRIYQRTVAPSSYDAINLHPYPAGLPPEGPLREELRHAHDVAPGRSVVFTETGYHNALASRTGQPPVSERAAAVYLPRALLWAFRAGVKRTFVYELLDEKPDPIPLDPERHFGLLRNNLSRKPAFDALRNLIQTVRGPAGRARAAPPRASVRAGEHIEQVVLTRRDGSRVLALWRPVSVWDPNLRHPVNPGRTAVDVAWPRAVRDLTVTRPSQGGGPVTTLRSARRLALQLEGDVVLLSYR